MQRLSANALLLLAALLGGGSHAYAQATTGTISGRVVSSDAQSLPGVTVATTSPMLQGMRTAVTSASGDYLIPLLPPGAYSVTFELDGFQTVRRTQQVAGAYNAAVDVMMSPSGVSEVVTVVADAQPFVKTAQVATNFKQNWRSMLRPTPSDRRTVDGASPACDGPARRVTINARVYENLYTLDGAIINENLRGAPMNPTSRTLEGGHLASAGGSAESAVCRRHCERRHQVRRQDVQRIVPDVVRERKLAQLHAVRIDAAHRKFIAEAEARQGCADPRSDVRWADRERTCLVLPGLASATAGIDEDDLLDQHPVHSHERRETV